MQPACDTRQSTLSSQMLVPFASSTSWLPAMRSILLPTKQTRYVWRCNSMSCWPGSGNGAPRATVWLWRPMGYSWRSYIQRRFYFQHYSFSSLKLSCKQSWKSKNLWTKNLCTKFIKTVQWPGSIRKHAGHVHLVGFSTVMKSVSSSIIIIQLTFNSITQLTGIDGFVCQM